MESAMERLSGPEKTAVDGLLTELFEQLKDTKQNVVFVKELKAYMYYSDLHTKNPLAYKVISDLELDPSTKLSAADFKKVFLGSELDSESLPTIEQLCMVKRRSHCILDF